MRLKHFLLFIVMIILIFSCRKEETQWKTKWKVPLAEGRLSLSNLVSDSLVQAGDDGVAHIVYESELTNFDLDTLVNLPDTLVSETYSPSIGGGPFDLPAGFVLINQTQETQYSLGDAELRKVRIRSGEVQIELINYVNGEITMSYTLEGAQGPSGVLSYEADAEPGSPQDPTIYEEIRDISGYELDLTGQNGNSHNTIAASFQAAISDDAGTTEIYGNDSISVNLRFVDVVIEYATGFFGEYESELVDTIDLGLFNQLSPGVVSFEDVNLSLDIENYVGMDARVTFNEILSLRSSPAGEVSLAHPFISQPLNITRAFDDNGQVVPTHTEVEFDNENSNIVDFAEVLPEQLAYDIDLILNPLADISLGNDFIYTDQSLEANLLLDIPLCLSIDDLSLRDTLNLNNDPIEDWAQGDLYLNVTNGFPFSAQFSLGLYDVESAETTHIGEGNITAATDGSSGIDYTPVNSTSEVYIPAELVGHFHKENKLVLEVTFNTANYPEMVKLKEEYYMDVKLTGDIDYEITVD